MTKEKLSRRERAEKLAAERAKRTPKQQLAHLDRLLGPDVGAKKERARLQAQIETEAIAEAKEREAKKGKKKDA
jgi:hypothetical protein